MNAVGRIKDLETRNKKLLAENEELRRKLTIAERRLENPDICKHGVLACIECEERCEDCGDDGTMAIRHGRRLCENCVYEHDQNGPLECAECEEGAA